MIGKFRAFGIRTAYSKTGVQQNLGKTGHTDAADPDKVDMNRFFKVDMVRHNTVVLSCALVLWHIPFLYHTPWRVNFLHKIIWNLQKNHSLLRKSKTTLFYLYFVNFS